MRESDVVTDGCPYGCQHNALWLIGFWGSLTRIGDVTRVVNISACRSTEAECKAPQGVYPANSEAYLLRKVNLR